jgi:hypothetical protein
MVWSNEQIERWCLAQSSYLGDMNTVIHDAEVDLRRTHAQHEMLQLLHTFLDDEITLKQFNTVFQQHTHKKWNDFHVRGMSGGLFLNRLVKYIPNEETFAHLLRMILRAPEQERDGQRQMQAFVRFLEGLIASQQAQRSELQPARVPFFLSIWWHMQAPEHWPIFYMDVREVLLSGSRTAERVRDPIADYFLFRVRFLSLLKELGMSSWQLEHLCSWYGQHAPVGSFPADKRMPTDLKKHHAPLLLNGQADPMEEPAAEENRTSTVIGGNMDAPRKDKRASTVHTHLQWLLAKLGHKVGCRVWIAHEDHDKIWQDERLGNLSLESFPVLGDSQFQQILQRIDVLWLLKGDVIAAYEIVHATMDVSSDLLRLYDLGALVPKRDVQLCVVTPRTSFEQVQFELTRPIFHEHQLGKRCAVLNGDLLLQQEDHILRWASSPSVIKDLTTYLGAGKA